MMLAGVGIVCPVVDGAEPARPVDFNFQVRPILSDKCYKCHGPDGRNQKAGLRLDTREGATGETPSGSRAVVPGDLEASELYQRITSDDESDADAAQVARPDAQSRGSRHPQALDRAGGRVEGTLGVPSPVAGAIPAVGNAAWARNPLDRFILARLEAEHRPPPRKPRRSG